MKRLMLWFVLLMLVSGSALGQDKGREALERFYPGYELQVYRANEAADHAEAVYTRVENGLLRVIRARFTAQREAPYVEECMPVPLTAEACRRLNKGEMDQLVNVDGAGDFLLKEDVLDKDKLYIVGDIVGSDLLEHDLVLLMQEEDGQRRIWLVNETDDGGYETKGSAVLPTGAFLDTTHAGPDEIQLDWMMADGQTMLTAVFMRDAGGRYLLRDVIRNNDLLYHIAFCGLQTKAGFLVGDAPQWELFGTDWAVLAAGTVPTISSDGWAVVNNPDPADRLHLRTEPSGKADSLGKFYNGTPVKALDQAGEWCQVLIGYDGLKGWMMKKYLTFGDDMRHVERAWLELMLRPEVPQHAAYPDMQCDDMQLRALEGTIWVVGVVEDEWFILLTDRGDVGYVPAQWMWEGNG